MLDGPETLGILHFGRPLCSTTCSAWPSHHYINDAVLDENQRCPQVKMSACGNSPTPDADIYVCRTACLFLFLMQYIYMQKRIKKGN